MRVLDMAEHLTDEQVAQRAAAAERNRRDEEQQRRQRDTAAAAERAKAEAVVAARGARLAAVVTLWVKSLRKNPDVTRWVSPDRILAAGDQEPPTDVVGYQPCLILTPDRTSGDGTGIVCVESRAVDARVLEHLWAAEQDQVSALMTGRQRVSGCGPLRLALAAARHEGVVRADDRRLVSNRYDADAGVRVQVFHGFLSRKDYLVVAIGPDPETGSRPPAREWKGGWTSAEGRRYGVGAD
ncbi:hypothetical protein [Gemmata sp.]|uniref:hypothetical protein n=1 Tax=Gemmata sp. TaxID=1914242 RepID=UPI003F7178D7